MTMSETSRRRGRRSAEQWRQLIHEQAASGLTQSAFCALHDIGVGGFQYWKRRLAVPVASDPWLAVGLPAERVSSTWEIELDLGDGICLRLRRC
jgi:hypothetical protein